MSTVNPDPQKNPAATELFPPAVSFKAEEREYKTSSERREYLREYYRRNREKYLQYQREYNLRHKKKTDPDHLSQLMRRPVVRLCLHAGDILRANPDRAARMINQIIQGSRRLAALS